MLISVLTAYFGRFTHFLTQSEQLTVLPKYTGNMPFIALQTLGCGAAQIILCIACLKRRKTFGAVFAIGSFVTMLFMGFLAAMDGKMDVTLWNWLEEITNTVSQGLLLAAVICIRKK